MHVVELSVGQGLVNVPQLVGIDVEVVVGDDAADKLAVQVVVGNVDGADAPVRVGVGVGARAKGSIYNWDGIQDVSKIKTNSLSAIIMKSLPLMKTHATI